MQGDVGEPLTARTLVDAALERWSRLDGVVNNAGALVTARYATGQVLLVDGGLGLLR